MVLSVLIFFKKIKICQSINIICTNYIILCFKKKAFCYVELLSCNKRKMYLHLLKDITLKHKKKGNNVSLMKHTYFFNTGTCCFPTHQITEIPSVAHNEEYLHKNICLTFTSTFYYLCFNTTLLFINMDIIN